MGLTMFSKRIFKYVTPYGGLIQKACCLHVVFCFNSAEKKTSFAAGVVRKRHMWQGCGRAVRKRHFMAGAIRKRHM